MDDDDGDKASAGGLAGNYANVVSQPACLHCPEPPYTDEARMAKLQGNVTLRVLIGADGRAARIQLVKSLGLGSTSKPCWLSATGALFPRVTPGVSRCPPG